MRFDENRKPSSIRSRRSLAVLVATGAGLGTLLVGTAPAHANATVKTIAPDGQSITFTTSDSDRRVSGNITFVVRANGNWSIEAPTRNPHIAWRNARWSCELLFGPSHSTITYRTGRHRVDGKESRNFRAGAYDADIQAFYGDITQFGQANCNIDVG